MAEFSPESYSQKENEEVLKPKNREERSPLKLVWVNKKLEEGQVESIKEGVLNFLKERKLDEEYFPVVDSDSDGSLRVEVFKNDKSTNEVRGVFSGYRLGDSSDKDLNDVIKSSIEAIQYWIDDGMPEGLKLVN